MTRSDEIKLIYDRYCIGMKSAVGNSKGKYYEDRAFVSSIKTASDLLLVVGAVADGVGSAEFGANAAQIAIDTAKDSIEKNSKINILEIILDAFTEANTAVIEENEKSSGDGLTTLVLSVIYNERCYVGNVGDSRAYWIQDSGKILQLTMDHSYYNLYGGDPNSTEASVLSNYIGKKAQVEVDLALYLNGIEDRKTASKFGRAGLPLEAGDSLLLCSDGLTKSDENHRPFTKPEELADAVKTEIGNNAAVKMVGFAEGRKVDDNVSAVVVQYLDKGRVEKIESLSKKRGQKVLFQRILTSFAFLVLISALMTVSVNLVRKMKEDPIVVFITNTAEPSRTPTQRIDPGKARVDQVSGQLASVTLKQEVNSGDIVSSGTGLVQVVLGATGGNNIIYLLENTRAQIIFSEKITPILEQGAIFVQPTSGNVAEVHFSKWPKMVATVTGSQMIVEIIGDDIWIYCFEGKCRLDPGGSDDELKIDVGSKRVYRTQLDAADAPIVMLYTELWTWNVKCNYCMTQISTPTPTPTLQSVSATRTKDVNGNPAVPPTAVPPTAVPPTDVPPTDVPKP